MVTVNSTQALTFGGSGNEVYGSLMPLIHEERDAAEDFAPKRKAGSTIITKTFPSM
jgi:hypothetical protein